MNVCVMDSPELKELYNSVKDTGESYESIKNLVNVWQLRKFNRNKNFDFTELPTKQDIENLLKERNVPNIDSTFIQEYTQEMKDILANAPRDEQGRLLAPNGKPSNLTERQYAQVRTKAFKEWFGDWERRATNFLGESTGNIDIADIINADGSINFKVLEEITDEYFNNADEKLFNKGRKTLRQRREKHYDGDGNLIENNTLEHLQNVTKSALSSNIRPDLKPQLILAAALHDLAKPFHGGQIHGFQSLNLVNKLFKGNISPLVKFAIKHHMLTTEENKKFSIDDATRIMQEALDNNLNLDDAVEILLAINTADILSGQSEDSIDYYSKKSKRDTINEEISFKKSLLVQAKNKLNDVSKVIDENGEPLVVYHGTTQDFTTFSKDKLGSFTHAASAKLAFFATSNENLAKDIYAELEDNEHFYERMLAIDPNFTREDLGIVPEDDPKDEIYSEFINNYDDLKYEYKDVIEEANKLITYKSSTEEITISKALEWVEDKDISDYEKEGFIISNKQLADYKEGKEITI